MRMSLGVSELARPLGSVNYRTASSARIIGAVDENVFMWVTDLAGHGSRRGSLMRQCKKYVPADRGKTAGFFLFNEIQRPVSIS